MAIPVIEAFTFSETATAGTSITGAKPALTAEGELLLFFHGTDGTRTLIEPSGASSAGGLNGGNISTEVSYLTAGAAEPENYTASANGSELMMLGVLRISGFNPADIIHKIASNTGADATPVCPSVDTTVANCRIIRCFVCDQPRLTTEDADYPANTLGLFNRKHDSSAGISMGMTHEEQVVAGPAGPASWSLSNGDTWVAWTIAIPENPGGTKGAALHHFLKSVGAR